MNIFMKHYEVSTKRYLRVQLGGDFDALVSIDDDMQSLKLNIGNTFKMLRSLRNRSPRLRPRLHLALLPRRGHRGLNC